MGNGNVCTTKYPDECVPDKHTIVGKRWVDTITSSKSVRVTSNIII